MKRREIASKAASKSLWRMANGISLPAFLQKASKIISIRDLLSSWADLPLIYASILEGSSDESVRAKSILEVVMRAESFSKEDMREMGLYFLKFFFAVFFFNEDKITNSNLTRF